MNKVEVSLGPWCPTNYLRWHKGKLQQRMRRRVKRFPERGSAWTSKEFEWQEIPTETEK